jgi:hypothetical protein
MEISVGIYAISFIFFFLIVPGFICRRFYYNGEFSKQLSLSNNGIVTLLTSFFIGIALTLGFVALYNFFASKQIVLDDVLNSFDQNFITETTDKTAEELNKEKFDGMTKAIYGVYVKYLGAFYFFAAIIGYFSSVLVLFFGLDTRIKFLRYKNEWHYLFTGKILKFKRKKPTSNNQKLKVKHTYLDVLVSQKDSETTLYSGLYYDYEINPVDICKLEKIHLLKATRYKKEGDAILQKNIPGSLFTILSENIVNINCTYIYFNEDEKKEKKYKLAKTWLFIFQLISTICFLSILTSFIFSVNFFDNDWYGKVLKQTFLVKILIVFAFNLAIGFITPFENKPKDKEVKFIGWYAIFAKIIVFAIVTFWTYKIYDFE